MKTQIVNRLIEVYDGATAGSNTQLESIAALGCAGGPVAAEKLISAYEEAIGSAKKIAIIDALGKSGDQSAADFLLNMLANSMVGTDIQIQLIQALGNCAHKMSVEE